MACTRDWAKGLRHGTWIVVLRRVFQISTDLLFGV
jgi:hypothetical protein